MRSATTAGGYATSATSLSITAARIAPAPLLRASLGDRPLLAAFTAWAAHRDECGRCGLQGWEYPNLAATCDVGRRLFAAWQRGCCERGGSGTLYTEPAQPYYIKQRRKRRRPARRRRRDLAAEED